MLLTITLTRRPRPISATCCTSTRSASRAPSCRSDRRTLRLSGEVRLRDLLTHLYVLVPVLDAQKHYWVGDDEVEKLLADEEPPAEEEAETRAAEEEAVEEPLRLNEKRLGPVVAALRASGAKSVLDLGCCSGKLLRALLEDDRFERIAGVDVSYGALEAAASRLRLDRMPPRRRARLELFQTALTYRDQRLAGFDAAAAVEVVEHLDPPRLRASSGSSSSTHGRGRWSRRRRTATTTSSSRGCRRAASATATTASSGRGRSSRPGAAASPASTGTPSASSRSAPRIRSRARRRRWRCSRGEARGPGALARRHAYRRYCRPVERLDDLKLAPFHLLASENAVHVDKPHAWHLERAEALVAADPELLRATAHVSVETTEPASEQAATAWWTELTEAGGEGWSSSRPSSSPAAAAASRSPR